MMREGRPSFGTRYRRPVSDHAEGAGRAALTPNPSPVGEGGGIGRPEGRPSFRTGYGPPDEGPPRDPHPNPLPEGEGTQPLLPAGP
jgi:hypothetical protein